MQEDMYKAALYIAENADISLEQIHFRRGAIWAGRKLLEVPNILSQLLLNDVMIEKAKEVNKTNPNKEK